MWLWQWGVTGRWSWQETTSTWSPAAGAVGETVRPTRAPRWDWLWPARAGGSRRPPMVEIMNYRPRWTLLQTSMGSKWETALLSVTRTAQWSSSTTTGKTFLILKKYFIQFSSSDVQREMCWLSSCLTQLEESQAQNYTQCSGNCPITRWDKSWVGNPRRPLESRVIFSYELYRPTKIV